MNLELKDAITFQAMLKTLQEKFPAYKIELKKNPIARFEYIQVYKSAFVGTWIRIMPKKNRVLLLKAIPSAWARALLGGLIAILIASGPQGRLRKEVAEVLKKDFNTMEQP